MLSLIFKMAADSVWSCKRWTNQSGSKTKFPNGSLSLFPFHFVSNKLKLRNNNNNNDKKIGFSFARRTIKTKSFGTCRTIRQQRQAGENHSFSLLYHSVCPTKCLILNRSIFWILYVNGQKDKKQTNKKSTELSTGVTGRLGAELRQGKKQKNMAAVTGTLIFIFLLCIKKQNKQDFSLSFAEMADLLYMLRVQVNDCVLLRK